MTLYDVAGNIVACFERFPTLRPIAEDVKMSVFYIVGMKCQSKSVAPGVEKQLGSVSFPNVLYSINPSSQIYD